MKADQQDPSSVQLGHRSAVAFSWGLLAAAVKVLLTLVVQAALARLLGPHEFGLFALGVLIMGVAGYFADVGLATSLVQKQVVHDADIRFVLTLNLLTAVSVAILVVALAEPLAQAFGKPEVKQIFQGLAPVFVLNAVASVSTSLLRRQLDYRSIQLANLVGYALGFGVVGIAAAALLGSVDALVAAYLCQAAVTLLLLYGKTRHPLALSLRADDRSALMGFGANILTTNLVNWAVGSLDRLLVGRLFSAAMLGHYSAAYNLIYAPVGALYSNLQSTVFSSMARMQGDLPRLQKTYLALLQAVSVIFMPIFVGLYSFSSTLVLVVYGAQWGEAALLAGPFSLMAPFLLVWACSTPVLWNTERRSLEWKLQLPFIVLVIMAVVLAAGVSIVAVAWVAAVAFIARTLMMIVFAFSALRVSACQAWAAVWPSLWISAVVGTTSMACAWLLRGTDLLLVAQLLLGVCLIGGALLICLLLVPNALPLAARRFIGPSCLAAPFWLKPLLNRLKGET